MPKVTKKTTKKTVKKSAPVSEIAMPEMAPMAMPTMPQFSLKKVNNKMLASILVVIVIAALTYKLGPWMFPAVVGNMPLNRFELWSRLEKNYGAQTLDDMVNEKILDNAIADSGVKIDQAKVDAQFKTLEDQFAATGGLDEALKQRGLTRKDLEKQVRTQIAIEELLADKIVSTDEEIKKQFDDNAKTLYADKKFEDVKDSIADELKQAKLRDAFLAWFADVKAAAKVKSFGL